MLLKNQPKFFRCLHKYLFKTLKHVFDKEAKKKLQKLFQKLQTTRPLRFFFEKTHSLPPHSTKANALFLWGAPALPVARPPSSAQHACAATVFRKREKSVVSCIADLGKKTLLDCDFFLFFFYFFN